MDFLTQHHVGNHENFQQLRKNIVVQLNDFIDVCDDCDAYLQRKEK